MSYNKKFEFIAQSLSKVMEKQTREFKKRNEKFIKGTLKQGDYKEYTQVMTGVIMESAEAMKTWGETSFEDLEGMTPEQYFLSLSSADDAAQLVSELIEKNGGMIPPSLSESIKKLSESIENEIAMKIDSMMPDKDGKLTLIQKAMIKCAEMISSEKIVDPVSRLLFRFDSNNAGDDEIQYIMDVFKEEGKASIPCIIAACEKSGHKGNIYIHCIMALGEIASKYKTEEIFMYLKECFRKSDLKLVEAGALGLYGDGRAVAAVRSYVERDILNINETVYSDYRNIILSLGGMTDDIDRKFVAVHRH